MDASSFCSCRTRISNKCATRLHQPVICRFCSISHETAFCMRRKRSCLSSDPFEHFSYEQFLVGAIFNRWLCWRWWRRECVWQQSAVNSTAQCTVFVHERCSKRYTRRLDDVDGLVERKHSKITTKHDQIIFNFNENIGAQSECD